VQSRLSTTASGAVEGQSTSLYICSAAPATPPSRPARKETEAASRQQD
jgi:hypothetical protein